MALTPVSEVSFDNEAKNTGRSLWRFTVKRKNLFPKTFALFGFPIFWLLAYLMKVIPKRAVRTKLDIYAFISACYELLY